MINSIFKHMWKSFFGYTDKIHHYEEPKKKKHSYNRKPGLIATEIANEVVSEDLYNKLIEAGSIPRQMAYLDSLPLNQEVAVTMWRLHRRTKQSFAFYGVSKEKADEVKKLVRKRKSNA